MVDAREWHVVEVGSRRRNGSGVPTIRDLIRAELDAGKSVRDLEADSGHRVKYQTFQELSNQPPKQFPKEVKTVQGMAQALRCTETAVVLAYAASLGIEVQGSDFALRLPPGVDDLDHEMKSALVSVVRAATKQGASHADQPDTRADPPPAEESRAQGTEDQKMKFLAYVADVERPNTFEVWPIAAEDLAAATRHYIESMEKDGYAVDAPSAPDRTITARRGQQVLKARVAADEQDGAVSPPSELFDAAWEKTRAGDKPARLNPEDQGRDLDSDAIPSSPEVDNPRSRTGHRSDYDLVARTGRGPSERERFDAAQDAAAEAPDPEGPEDGA